MAVNGQTMYTVDVHTKKKNVEKSSVITSEEESRNDKVITVSLCSHSRKLGLLLAFSLKFVIKVTI